ncbi:MAG: heme-binding protein [Streptosporangiales bacterium]|nr:heme-binding protein [Streptosporangiales bacterium]
MTRLGLAAAQTIAAEAIALGRRAGYQPLTVSVLDGGGHVVLLHREDGSGILRPQIASGKAWGALGMGLGSRELGVRARERPEFFAALSALAPGGLVPVAGGVLVRDPRSRDVLGAVGISGDTSDHDEECAVHGIERAALLPDSGA